MKPLPEAVQHAFPCAPGRLPERPWWFRGYGDIEPRYARVAKPDYNLTVEEATAYDAAHPLPHPGYRAGQVWADDNGSSVVVCAFLYGTVWTSRDTTGVLRADFARAWPYLMADPACPHLAPWSPTAPK